MACFLVEAKNCADLSGPKLFSPVVLLPWNPMTGQESGNSQSYTEVAQQWPGRLHQRSRQLLRATLNHRSYVQHHSLAHHVRWGTFSVDLLELLSTNFFKLSQPKSKGQAPKRTKEVIDLQENVALRGDLSCASRPESRVTTKSLQ